MLVQGKSHYIRDCKISILENKGELVEAFRAKKEAGSIRRVREFSDISSEGGNDRGRIRAKIQDEVPVWVSGDYGENHADICDTHLNKLDEANKFVPILPLQKPVTMEIAFAVTTDSPKISADRKERI